MALPCRIPLACCKALDASCATSSCGRKLPWIAPRSAHSLKPRTRTFNGASKTTKRANQQRHGVNDHRFAFIRVGEGVPMPCRVLALVSLVLSMWACNTKNSSPDLAPAGGEKSTKTATLEAGAKALQRDT